MSHSPELAHLQSRWADAPDGTAFAALADGLRKAGALGEAEAVALVGLERHPELVPGLIALARIRQAQGDLVAAEATLQRALGHDPSHPVVLEGLADLAVETGHSDSARAWATLASIAESPDEPAPPVKEDGALPAEDDWNDPIAFGDDEGSDAAADEDDPVLVTESLARLYHLQGHLERAAVAYQTLAARHPEQPAFAEQAEALERELLARRPRPFDAAASGGTALGDWLARVAVASPEGPTAEPGYDAFFEPTLPAARETSDFAAFQEWLKGLGG